MSAGGRWLEYALFLALIVALARPTGLYVVRVFSREPTWLDPALRPLETGLCRLLGVRADQEMTAGVYALSFVLFGLIGSAGLFLLLMVQQWLPGGPAVRYLTTPMSADLAVNTAVSFATTTTWQAYAGESTLRYLTQAVGLVSQNFLAGASGLAVGIAFIRGFAREKEGTLGNFWVDLIRGLLWILIPVALVGSLFLVWQGVPLDLAPYAGAHTLEGGLQTIALGPVAALELIKNLGSNGGGFFNANGADPFEGPTPLANFVGLLAIAVLPASLPVAFGRMTGRPRAGWVLLGVMVALFAAGLAVCDRAEAANPARLAAFGLRGPNLEGKETRFGVGDSVLTAVVTSNGATGSANAMDDSLQPIGVAVPLANMLLGEVAFGGLGSGLYAMVMITLVAAFLGGLMIGRTPSFLGKRIGRAEMQLATLYALFTPTVVLGLSALALAVPAGRAGLVTNTGSRAFTEVVFAYASCMANNGQAMAGLSTDSPFYNLTTMAAMLAGRFGLAALALALAGRMVVQPRVAMSSGSLPTDTPQFGALIFATVLLVGGLCFLPVLVLGPMAEALAH
jgi:K+-transporting ATPase ATPase A chain